MMRVCGDNMVCTFGTESNPSMLVARAINNLTGVPTTFAVRELDRLVAMYGDPTVKPLFVSYDTTFDMICDDLVEHGWYLWDSARNWVADPSDLWSGTNTFFKVAFMSAFGDARCELPLHADMVLACVTDFESSGCWIYAGSVVL